MPVLRLLFIVLLLLNLLALAASTGFLGLSGPRGEPERLTNQLNPERIRLQGEPAVPLSVPPAVATSEPPLIADDRPAEPPPAADSTPAPSTTAPPAIGCIAFDGLGGDAADAVVHHFDIAGLSVQRTGAEAISGWWVRIPSTGARDYAERKARELRALGVDEFYIVQDPGPNQYAVSLGLFKTEAAAVQHLERLRKLGVRSASIGTRSTTVYRVEVQGAQALIDARTRAGQLPPTARAGSCVQR
ncbi:SPOR domain-containing protein [Zoogloeaceae bacteirum Par-f-2]|nr:SPOR domain-containing protein [Zoogloeaceae bacteirum Par-f-2]